ncbi:MAG: hypothetical protein WBG86_04085 [Polyangiales bacterium]
MRKTFGPALFLIAATACASNPPSVTPTPSPDAPNPTSAVGTATATTEPGSDATVYRDPQIEGHPVAQCVTGQGWGAFDRGRCDPESQRIVADEFCASQEPSGTATDWELDEGARGRHSVWRYDRGTSPSHGNWIREVATDGFAEIHCKPSQ